MTNMYRLLRDLLPEPPLQVGVVTLVYAPGGVQVTLPDGGVVIALGTATLGASVFVRDGVVQGPAPSLPTTIIEV